MQDHKGVSSLYHYYQTKIQAIYSFNYRHPSSFYQSNHQVLFLFFCRTCWWLALLWRVVNEIYLWPSLQTAADWPSCLLARFCWLKSMLYITKQPFILKCFRRLFTTSPIFQFVGPLIYFVGLHRSHKRFQVQKNPFKKKQLW